MHTRSGAQTTVGSPAPKEYITRPSGPGDGAFFSPCQRSLTRTASSAVEVSGTSAFGRRSFGAVPLVAPGKLPGSSILGCACPCTAGGIRFTPAAGGAGGGDCADSIHAELRVTVMTIRSDSISFLLPELYFREPSPNSRW